MTILKQLIESMIIDYLEESYEDDLVESIFEEVSEETWEAIEEAILNELSPELLNRYKKAAWKDAGKSYKKVDSAKTKEDEDRHYTRGDKRMSGYARALGKTSDKGNRTFTGGGGKPENVRVKAK
jgi:macrodomain Ter protein organizer (MatP/YcbG family)